MQYNPDEPKTDWKTPREAELVQKAIKDTQKRAYVHMRAVRENIASLLYIEQSILEGDTESAKEAWAELDEQAQIDLFLAYTKGGFFTTAEWKILRSE